MPKTQKLKIKKLESETDLEECISTRMSRLSRVSNVHDLSEQKVENKFTYNTNIKYTKAEYFTVDIQKRTPSQSPRDGLTSTKNSSDEISCENFESYSTKSFCDCQCPMNTEGEINDEILLIRDNSNIRLTMSASEMTNNSNDIFDVAD